VGERSLHTREVAGSKPAAPMFEKPRCGGVFHAAFLSKSTFRLGFRAHNVPTSVA
jgi:hypothetical protein